MKAKITQFVYLFLIACLFVIATLWQSTAVAQEKKASQTEQEKTRKARELLMKQARDMESLQVKKTATIQKVKQNKSKKKVAKTFSTSMHMALDDNYAIAKQYTNKVPPTQRYSSFYLQYIEGDIGDQVRQNFLKVLRDDYDLKVVEVLPVSLQGVGLLRLYIEDFSIWETKESIKVHSMHFKSKEVWPKFVIRRNVLIRFRIELYNAKKRTLESRTTYIHPFQQVYTIRPGQKAPVSKKEELQRLSLLLIKRMINSELNYITDKQADEYAPVKFFSYDRRLNKASSFVEKGFEQEAIWLWNIILYTPLSEQSDEDYLKAKRDAFYNLGIFLSREHKWKDAIYMFSQANRLDPQVTYANLWGKMTYHWLYEQKVAEIRKKQEKKTGTSVKKTLPKKTVKVKKKRVYKKEVPRILPIPNNVRLLESLSPLLLQPSKLWTEEELILNTNFDTYIPKLLNKFDENIENKTNIDEDATKKQEESKDKMNDSSNEKQNKQTTKPESDWNLFDKSK